MGAALSAAMYLSSPPRSHRGLALLTLTKHSFIHPTSHQVFIHSIRLYMHTSHEAFIRLFTPSRVQSLIHHHSIHSITRGSTHPFTPYRSLPRSLPPPLLHTYVHIAFTPQLRKRTCNSLVPTISSSTTNPATIARILSVSPKSIVANAYVRPLITLPLPLSSL